MNDFLDFAKARYSVRAYKPTPIPDDVLARVLEAGQVAPTACNAQAVHTYVLQSDAAIVATHMMLEAWDQGLGTCWVNLFPNSRLAAELAIAPNNKPVLLMPIGFPADNATPNPLHHQTRPLAELVTIL